MSTLAAVDSPIASRAVAELRPHPFNTEIYGDDGAEDADLRTSIKSHGVLVPLVALEDGRIISGHRRWAAAKAEGLVEVPTRPYEGDPGDETEIKAAILEHNRQRVKTEDQRVREVAAMLEIEQERGRRKKAAGGAHGGALAGRGRPIDRDGAVVAPSLSGNARAPKSSAVVGEALGMSARQVERAAAVIKSMDEMVAAGDYRGAEEVRQTLNKEGIGQAYREVRKARGEAPGPIRTPGGEPAAREARHAIPHDAVRAALVIRRNFTREFIVALIEELGRGLDEERA